MLVNRMARDRLVRHLLVTDLLDTDKESKIAKGTNDWPAGTKGTLYALFFFVQKREFFRFVVLYIVKMCRM